MGHTATPMAPSASSSGMELREQRRLDAVAGLVAGPHAVAKRLDDVIGRDADVRCSLLDHLQQRLEHADHAAEGRILPLAEAAQAVEVTEQLVRAVHDVDDQRRVTNDRHSLRNASSGSRRAARRAGSTPATMPTATASTSASTA